MGDATDATSPSKGDTMPAIRVLPELHYMFAHSRLHILAVHLALRDLRAQNQDMLAPTPCIACHLVLCLARMCAPRSPRILFRCHS
jgi:hypothetical protein